MKKLVLASALALASIAFVTAPKLRAQDSGQVSLPAEQFNDYQNATTQTDPKVKAAALEAFLTKYPQTPVKNSILDMLIDTYQAAGDSDHALSAATRMLQVDPNNMKAIFLSVFIKRTMCQKGIDPQTGDEKDAQSCDDSAALAQKGLAAPKPSAMSDADWKTLTSNAYPIFHSAIAFDDAIAKKDFAAAIKEYTTELMLYSADQSKTGTGLVDTLNMAEAYVKPGDARDVVKACWFYARAWNFAPAAYKSQIEPKLEYWYKRWHGNLDGLNDVKTASAGTLFPPSTFAIAPAPKPDEIVHGVITSTPDLTKLNLEDKEFILANGNKEDVAKLWDVLKDQQTPVPGVLIDAPVNAIAISVTKVGEVKATDYTVALAKPMACTDAPAETATTRAKLDFITANAAPSDASKIADVTALEPAKIKKLTVDLGASQLKVAVTEDAKASKSPDFIVNMKEAVGCKDLPPIGSAFALQPEDELDATYDNYTQQPAANPTVAPTAQIVLRDGFIQAKKKAPAAPVRRRPAAGTAAHHTGM